MKNRLIPLLLVLTSPLSCFFEREPPGYTGSVPSARGQVVLQQLQGQVFVDESGVFGGGDWTIGPFGVVPNPVTGKGPVVQLQKDGETRYLPVETQGDVADLYRRVTGRSTPLVSGETSEHYRSALGGP